MPAHKVGGGGSPRTLIQISDFGKISAKCSILRPYMSQRQDPYQKVDVQIVLVILSPNNAGIGPNFSCKMCG